VGKLIYAAIASLDGYVADAEGRWDWSFPDADVHAHVNDRARALGTHLYGRRMYEVLVAWETMEDDEPLMQDYARSWRAADKIVYSSSLEQVASARTRLERAFDPAAVRGLKETAAHDLSIGGPTLAAEAIRAGLVDECELYLSPVVVGGGTRALPDEVRWDLDLRDERRFANGVVYVRYATVTS
jgi:dihydrofolate reductase